MSSPPSGAPPVRWRVRSSTGSAEAFHQRDPEPDGGHHIWIHTPPRPALILGSTQPPELVRADRARLDGIEVCRRRSGGGLVHLDPATDCWLDAIVPAGSPWWDDDVGKAFHWLGQHWGTVLDDLLGPSGPALVHRPAPTASTPARPLWCFSGVGHGEVTVGASKVVGLSQRRTRGWIRLQSLVLGRWPGSRLLPYVDLDVARAIPGIDPEGIDPSAVPAGPPVGIRLPSPAVLAATFVDRLGADAAGASSVTST